MQNQQHWLYLFPQSVCKSLTTQRRVAYCKLFRKTVRLISDWHWKWWFDQSRKTRLYRCLPVPVPSLILVLHVFITANFYTKSTTILAKSSFIRLLFSFTDFVICKLFNKIQIGKSDCECDGAINLEKNLHSPLSSISGSGSCSACVYYGKFVYKISNHNGKIRFHKTFNLFLCILPTLATVKKIRLWMPWRDQSSKNNDASPGVYVCWMGADFSSAGFTPARG